MEQKQNGTPQYFTTTHLYDPKLSACFERLFLPQTMKERGLNYLDTFAKLSNVRASSFALSTRRSILFVGEPGTGKSTYAKGLPNRWAETRNEEALLVSVNPDTLAIGAGERGGSQKNIVKLFESLGEVASMGFPTFVVIDEAETLGTNRGNINPTTNPQDSIFAVNALIRALDETVQNHPNLIFIFTSNFVGNLDPAIVQRMDFSMVFPRPDFATRLLILQDALKEIRDLTAIPPVPVGNGRVRKMARGWVELAKTTEGFSGRQLRKLIVSGLTFVNGSEPLKLHHLLRAVQDEHAQRAFHRKNGGVCLHEFQKRN